MLEVIVAFCIEEFKMKRKVAVFDEITNGGTHPAALLAIAIFQIHE